MISAILEKARPTKYKRRWKGSDGRWHYEYPQAKKPGHKFHGTLELDRPQNQLTLFNWAAENQRAEAAEAEELDKVEAVAPEPEPVPEPTPEPPTPMGSYDMQGRYTPANKPGKGVNEEQRQKIQHGLAVEELAWGDFRAAFENAPKGAWRNRVRMISRDDNGSSHFRDKLIKIRDRIKEDPGLAKTKLVSAAIRLNIAKSDANVREVHPDTINAISDVEVAAEIVRLREEKAAEAARLDQYEADALAKMKARQAEERKANDIVSARERAERKAEEAKLELEMAADDAAEEAAKNAPVLDFESWSTEVPHRLSQVSRWMDDAPEGAIIAVDGEEYTKRGGLWLDDTDREPRPRDLLREIPEVVGRTAAATAATAETESDPGWERMPDPEPTAPEPTAREVLVEPEPRTSLMPKVEWKRSYSAAGNKIWETPDKRVRVLDSGKPGPDRYVVLVRDDAGEFLPIGQEVGASDHSRRKDALEAGEQEYRRETPTTEEVKERKIREAEQRLGVKRPETESDPGWERMPDPEPTAREMLVEPEAEAEPEHTTETWESPENTVYANKRIRAALRKIPALNGHKYSVRAGRGTAGAWISIEGKTPEADEALRAYSKENHGWSQGLDSINPDNRNQKIRQMERDAGIFTGPTEEQMQETVAQARRRKLYESAKKRLENGQGILDLTRTRLVGILSEWLDSDPAAKQAAMANTAENFALYANDNDKGMGALMDAFDHYGADSHVAVGIGEAAGDPKLFAELVASAQMRVRAPLKRKDVDDARQLERDLIAKLPPRDQNSFVDAPRLKVEEDIRSLARAVNTKPEDTGQRAALRALKEYQIPDLTRPQAQLRVVEDPKPVAEPEVPTKAAPEAPNAAKLGVRISAMQVDAQRATAAYRHTSYSPEKRAEQEREGYVNEMDRVAGRLLRAAGNDPEKLVQAKELFADYARKYRAKNGARLDAKSRTASTMITGRSGFNTRRNDKANNVEHKRTGDLLDWAKYAEKKMLNTINPPSISSDRPDAGAKIEDRIKALENWRADAKKLNKIARSKTMSKEAKVEAMMEAGASEKTAREGVQFNWRMGFDVTGLTREIARLNIRLVDMEAESQIKAGEHRFEEQGVTVEEDENDNRIRLHFDEKPDPDMITKLKRNGFKWSRKNGAWQRQRNENTRNTLAYQFGLDVRGKDPE